MRLLAPGPQTWSFFQIKLWRLPGAGDTLPSVPGLVLGPEELPVEVLQFHPTSDGVLVSTAGGTVKVWDVAKQQSLTGTATLAAPVPTTLPFSVVFSSGGMYQGWGATP